MPPAPPQTQSDWDKLREPILIPLLFEGFTYLCIKTVKWSIVSHWFLKKAFQFFKREPDIIQIEEQKPELIGMRSFKRFLNHTTDTGPG